MGIKLKNPVKTLVGGGAGAGLGSMVGMGPFGSIVGGIAGAAPKGGIQNLLFGKDVVTPADQEAAYLKETQLRASQAQRGGLEALMAQSPQDVAEANIAGQSQALRTNLEDQRRQIQQNIARRGLQNTSLGQTALIGAQRNAGRGISSLLASQPLLERDVAEQLINAGAKVSAAQNVPLRFEPETTRKKGIAGLLGMLGGGALGAAYGGPQGAYAGSQMGYGAGEGISGMVG